MALSRTWAFLSSVFLLGNIMYPFVLQAVVSSTSSHSAWKVPNAEIKRQVPVRDMQGGNLPRREQAAQPMPSQNPAGAASAAHATRPTPRMPQKPGEALQPQVNLLETMQDTEPKSICNDPGLLETRGNITALVQRKRRIQAERNALVDHYAEACQAKEKYVLGSEYSDAFTAVSDLRATTALIERKTLENSETDIVITAAKDSLALLVLQVAESNQAAAKALAHGLAREQAAAVEQAKQQEVLAREHNVTHHGVKQWIEWNEMWVETQQEALDSERYGLEADMREAVGHLEMEMGRSTLMTAGLEKDINDLEAKLKQKRAEMAATQAVYQRQLKEAESLRRPFMLKLEEISGRSIQLETFRDGIAVNRTVAQEELRRTHEAHKTAQKVLYSSYLRGNITKAKIDELAEAAESYECIAKAKYSFQEMLEAMHGQERRANAAVEASLENVAEETRVQEAVEAELDGILATIARAEERLLLANKRKSSYVADRDRWIASANYRSVDHAEHSIKIEDASAERAKKEIDDLQPSRVAAEERLRKQQDVLDGAKESLKVHKQAAAQARYNTIWMRAELAKANSALRAFEQVDSVRYQMDMDLLEMSDLNRMYNITVSTADANATVIPECNTVVCDSVSWDSI
mmetsp:Transcript_6492/g.18128  ORF Transcript_6492/g.18128 Transcript_6492/m.18128 type:complete len:637 (+) Transcript_6492:302-2212(+)